jgi:hypothetical protein
VSSRRQVVFVTQSPSSRSHYCRAVVIVAQSLLSRSHQSYSRSRVRPVVFVVPSRRRHPCAFVLLSRRPSRSVAPSVVHGAVAPSSPWQSRRHAPLHPSLPLRHNRVVTPWWRHVVRHRCRSAVVPSRRRCNVAPLSSSRRHTITPLRRRALASSEFRRHAATHAVFASESLRRAVVLLHRQGLAFRVSPSRSE